MVRVLSRRKLNSAASALSERAAVGAIGPAIVTWPGPVMTPSTTFLDCRFCTFTTSPMEPEPCERPRMVRVRPSRRK